MSPLSELRVLQARVVDRFALSAVQAGMLVHALNRSDEPGLDVQQISITVQHALDPALYVYAWYTVMERHAVLRSRLRWAGVDAPVQEVLDAVEIPVTRADWRGLEPSELRRHLQGVAHQERIQGFDLTQAPLMRLHLARIGDLSWNILWTFHHVLLDGRAFDTILAETFEVHDCLRQRREVVLPPALAYRNDVDLDDDNPASLRYWATLLKGAHGPTPLGIDLPSNAAQRLAPEVRFGARQHSLSLEETAALRQRAEAAGVSLHTLLMAAWGLLLSRYGGSDDVLFGSTHSLRYRLPEPLRRASGMLINTVPVRLRIDREQPIDEWLPQLRQLQLNARPHAHVPLAQIHQAASLAPGEQLFDTLLVYDHQSLSRRMSMLGGAWESRHVDHVGQTGFALTLVAYGDPQLLLRIEYDRRRFSDGTIERMLGHLGCVLAGLASDGYERVGQLPWVTPAEICELIGEPIEPFPAQGLLHQGFEAHARRTPHAPALTVIGDDGQRREWSYRQLDRQATVLAQHLRSLGAQPGRCIGLRCERNADMALGMLAILKAGAAYLPLDPMYPRERAAYMIEDAQARIVVCSPRFAHEWASADLVVVQVDLASLADQADDSQACEPLQPPALGEPGDMAYVIYTSGSTGQPKGVPITHYNVCRLFDSTQPLFGFDDRDVWTLFHSYSFDFSVWEIWGAWTFGGRLLCVSQAQSRDPAQWVEMLANEHVTVLNQTPTAFRRLIDEACSGQARSLSLRYVVFGGEALDLQMLRPWFERYGDTRPQLVNMYGITETTVHVTWRPLQLTDLDESIGSVIGEPLSDLRLYLINQQGELVPRGVPGEMAVAGGGLSPGYLNRPDLTEQRFVPDPFSKDPDARLYLSGDMARWLDNGDLEYLGRRDHQVKIRGFRIELGEIESQLARHPHVRQAVVVAREDVPGDRRLVAYVVPALLGRGVAEGAPEPELASELRLHLRSRLPDYMVPAHFVCLDELPMTGNGKLDRAALPSPSERAGLPEYTTDDVPDSRGHAAAAPRVGPLPADPLEEPVLEARIAAIWADVLRVPVTQVGERQHFMELGGDSILSIQVVARCRKAGWPLTLKDLFDHPTVVALAQCLRVRLSHGGAASGLPTAPQMALSTASKTAATAPIAAPTELREVVLAPPAAPATPATPATMRLPEPVQQAVTLPLTPIQHWFFDQAFADADHWNQAFAFELTLPVSGQQVQRAWAWLAQQHPELRQRFHRTEQGFAPLPMPDTQAAPAVVVQAGHLNDMTAMQLIEERASEAQAGLSFERGPVARLLFVDNGAQRAARLVLVVHHLVVDGVSWRVMREDLEAALQTLRRGDVLQPLPPAPSMAQWAHALVIEAQQPHILAQWPYWRELGTQAAWTLPPPRGAGAMRQPPRAPDVQRRQLSMPQTDTLLKTLPSVCGASMQAALLSTLADALHRLTGADAWRIDMEGHGREPLEASPGASLDVSRTVGWFTSLFPHILRHGTERSEPARVGQTQAALHALPGKGLGHGLLRWLHADGAVRASLARAVPSPLLFNYLGQWDAVLAGSQLMRPARESTGPWRSPRAHCSHPLELVCQIRDGCLEVQATSDGQRVEPTWVAALVDAWMQSLEHLARTVTPAAVPSFPLTPLQHLFMAVSGAVPDPGLQQWQFSLQGPLVPATLRLALEQVVARHGILRTAFRQSAEGEPEQRVLDSAAVALSWRDDDWSDVPSAEQQARLARGLAADRSEPFRLDQPPLMRVWLIRLSPTHWHLVWTTHHLILDGWSWPLLMAEWSRACTAVARGNPPDEPEALQFQDYVGWLTQDWPRSHAADARSYWARTLQGLSEPTPVSPANGNAPVCADECVRVLGAETAQALVLRARQWRLTPGTLMLAAWTAVLAHRADAIEVSLGCTLSGRPAELPGVESLIGPCVNNVPLLVTLQPAQTLLQWLGQLQLQQQEAQQYQYLGLEAIQQLSDVPWRHRLFDSLLVFQNYPQDADAQRMGDDVACRALEVPQSTAFPLTLAVQVDAGGWRFHAMGRGAGLDAEFLSALLGEVRLMLSRLADAAGHETVGDWMQQLPTGTRGLARRPATVPAVAKVAPAEPAPAVPSEAADIHTLIVGVWQELLGQQAVPLDTNFFEMGVQSLQLVRAHRLLQERIGRPLRLLDMVEHPTVNALARAWSAPVDEAENPLAAAAMARARRSRHAHKAGPRA